MFPLPLLSIIFSALSHHKCNIHLSFRNKWRKGSADHETPHTNTHPSQKHVSPQILTSMKIPYVMLHFLALKRWKAPKKKLKRGKRKKKKEVLQNKRKFHPHNPAACCKEAPSVLTSRIHEWMAVGLRMDGARGGCARQRRRQSPPAPGTERHRASERHRAPGTAPGPPSRTERHRAPQSDTERHRAARAAPPLRSGHRHLPRNTGRPHNGSSPPPRLLARLQTRVLLLK